MIKALRVDERLVHGQIAMVWSKDLKLDGLVVANDETAANPTQQMALKMAVPSGIKIIIKSVDDAAALVRNPKAGNMRLMVLVRTVADAVKFASQVEGIEYVNVGNVGKTVSEDKKTITKFVMLTDSEIASLKELVTIYPETAFQVIPSDEKTLASEIISKQGL